MLDLMVEEDPMMNADRSDLESVDCPAQMAFVRQKIVLNQSIAMDSGNAVHDAFSGATKQYVSSRGSLNAGEVSEEAKTNLVWDSRPDLIWNAWNGFSPAMKSWGWFITKIHPENVLRFDGGDGEQSGQLAIDFADLGLRCTSEVDLLYAGPSPELLHEVDYKSGFARWTQSDVQNAFQFRFHAALVFHNYPHIPAVEIRVWNTRWNDLTYGVIFKRERDYELILMEVRRRAEAFRRYHDKQPDDVPANPDVNRCGRCPAVAVCTLSKHLAEPVANPGEYLKVTAAMQRIVDARLELLEQVVKTTGQEVIATDGTCFGFKKPKRETKPKAAVYVTGKSEGDE